ncbi:hypothetical protein ACFU0X_28480 [Streptomyces cellulosae]|uniref:HTH cro/C1-type domain-containing protein n=1 Tax=Streptomyces cellulosae TaxID=1968 RepID=A0ABW6JPK5_STRCE
MTAAPEPRTRLAQYIERRIAALALEYAEVCRRADISDETLGKIRKGMKARGSTYLKLERALEWEQGSIATILEGGEPTLRSDAEHSDDAGRSTESQGFTQELALAQRLLAATIREMDLTPDEAEEVWRRVRLELKATHRSHASRNRTNDRNSQAG